MNASRQSFVVSALICVALGALFATRFRLMPYPVEAPFDGGMPLAAALTHLTVTQPWVATAIGAVLLGWTLLLIVQMTVKFAPAASRNFLPAQIFLIAGAGVVIPAESLAALAAVWLLVMALRQLIYSFHKEQRFGELFHAGFFLGFMPLLYAPATAVVPAIVIAALAIYRRSGREAVVAFTGLVLPLLGSEFIRWATGTPGEAVWSELWRCATVQRDVLGMLPRGAMAVAGLVGLMAMVAVMWMAGHKKGVRKTPAHFMQHTSLVLIFMAASALVPGTSTTLVPLVAVPGALIVPFAFMGRAGRLSTIIYCLLLAAVLALDLLPFLGISALDWLSL
jgi:hypothetical protein